MNQPMPMMPPTGGGMSLCPCCGQPMPVGMGDVMPPGIPPDPAAGMPTGMPPGQLPPMLQALLMQQVPPPAEGGGYG